MGCSSWALKGVGTAALLVKRSNDEIVFFFACSLQRAARIKPNGPLPLPSTHGLSLAPDGLSWGLKGAGTAAVLMKRTAKPKSKFSSPSPAARGRAARSEPAHC
jgi:hypothetical protein